jgi:aminoglycoside phosphotransferase (APT) family kinase protein
MAGPQLTAEALQGFLDYVARNRGPQVRSVTAVAGGYSRDTAIADVAWEDGASERFVLRGDPPPSVFLSDRAAEWRVLQALARTNGSVRIPTPRWFDADGQYFGTRCIVSEFYESRSLQDLAREHEEGDMTEVRNQFVDAVIDIHRTPLDDLASELPRPADWDTYIDSLLGMIDHYSRSGRDSRPGLRYAAARLRAYRPPPVPLTLVHGDCQPSNFLVGDDGCKVIDWEFARIGDPREDIGYYSQIPVPPNVYQFDPEGFLARYREGSGLSEEQLNGEVVDFFYLLGLIRLYGQMMDAADAVADGQHRGVMATYLINGVSYQYRTYFDIARRLGDQAEMSRTATTGSGESA